MYLKIIAVGRVGKEPEMRYLADGTAVTAVSLAVGQGFGDKKYTVWLNLSIFGRLGETANEYIHKGDIIAVDGILNPDRSTGGPRIYKKRDETPGASYEVRVDSYRFVSSSHKPEDGGASQPASQPAVGLPMADDDYDTAPPF